MAKRTDPVEIVKGICASVGPSHVRQKLEGPETRRLRAWITGRQTPALFDWLMSRVVYQGISDAIAESYVEKHGNISFAQIERALQAHRCKCPKLEGFEAYRDCHYRKTDHSCNARPWLKACPLPEHDLRNGVLNQLAYSCFLFVRDVCQGDLVRFIDTTLAKADKPAHPDRIAMMRSALLSRLSRIHGIGLKVIGISFSDILMAAPDNRERWFEVGSSLVAVDSLIHNLFHRTGILARWNGEHAYGPSCYGKHGCALIIDRLAREIDARNYAPEFPCYFPRFIEHCLWAFSAEAHLDICNGNTVDDTRRCDQHDCPVYAGCARLALRSPAKQA
jgi:hypothetical protein